MTEIKCQNKSYDIVIIGGGIVGQLLAAMLGEIGYKVAIIEKKPLISRAKNNFDNRSIALSYPSICIMKSLGIWNDIECHTTYINNVDISDKGAFRYTSIDKSTESFPFLGAVIQIPHLLEALSSKLSKYKTVDVISPYGYRSHIQLNGKYNLILENNNNTFSITASHIIACDGMNSVVRSKLNIPVEQINYNQSAFVFNIKLKRGHNNIACERFLNNEIIAMLPLENQMVSCVWVMSSDQLVAIETLNDSDLMVVLQKKFGYKLGRFLKIGTRNIFPLRMIRASKDFDGNILLFGNSAHTLHPVAAQSFNLCIRDIGVLHDHLKLYGLNNDTFKNYSIARMNDHTQTIKMTDNIINIFNSNNMLIKFFRRKAITLIDHNKFCKLVINHVMMGRLGKMSSLVKNHTLD